MTGRLEYKNHLKGSRAAYVHKAFDDKGAKGAFREGEKQGVSKRSVQNWISQWKPADEKQVRKASTTKSAKKAKKVAKKTVVKKAVKKVAKKSAPKTVKKVVPKAAKKSAPRKRVVKDVALEG